MGEVQVIICVSIYEHVQMNNIRFLEEFSI